MNPYRENAISDLVELDETFNIDHLNYHKYLDPQIDCLKFELLRNDVSVTNLSLRSTCGLCEIISLYLYHYSNGIVYVPFYGYIKTIILFGDFEINIRYKIII